MIDRPMSAVLTIEQLAAQSGMTVRNIRAHQARGLLDPPEVRLRVGYYGPEHVERLNLIRRLQEDGFNLAGIKRLLDDDPEPDAPGGGRTGGGAGHLAGQRPGCVRGH
jgi:DNA-binding transcriptional MerR regulator